MHKLIDYVCEELKDLEKKAEKDGLSMSEIQYADTLAHLKKNLMKADEMEMDNEYSQRGYTMRTMPPYYGNSYAGRRNAKRDSMGRYSSDGYSRNGYSYGEDEMKEIVEDIRGMMNTMPEEKRRKVERLVNELER